MYAMPRSLGSFFFQILRFMGCGTRIIDSLFFKFIWEKNSRWIISLTLWFNLRIGATLQDYSSKSITQPRCSQESIRKACSRQSSRDLKTASEVLRSLQYSTMKSSGVCQIRDHGMPKYGTGHVLPRCHIKYSCTIRTINILERDS